MPASVSQKAAPSTLKKAANFAGALAQHVAAGLPVVSDEEYEARLAQCNNCELRHGDVCTSCGCNLSHKAWWKEQRCPHPNGDKWPCA